MHLLRHNQTSVSKANSGLMENTNEIRQDMEDPSSGK
jgi:hypothetical protein